MNHNPFIFFLAEEKDNQDSVQMITTMPFLGEIKVHTSFLWKLTCFNGINGPRHLSIIIKTSTLVQENTFHSNVLTAVFDLISQ